MLHCQICHKTYKNACQYNDHLTRHSHYSNLMKYEMIFGRNKNHPKHEEWLQVRDESCKIRKEDKKEKKD